MRANALHHHAPQDRTMSHAEARDEERATWLFLVAPVSFLATLVTIAWLSLQTLP